MPQPTLFDYIKRNHHRFHFFFVLIIATAISFGFYLTSTISIKAQTIPIGGKQVLTQNDFKYVGAFNLPATPTGDSYYNMGLALRHVGSELRMFTMTWNPQEIYEMKVPVHTMTAPFPRATIVKNWGHPSVSLIGERKGLYWDEQDQRLYHSYGNPYNSCCPDDHAVAFSTLNNTTGTLVSYGGWKFTGRGAKMTNNCVIAIPDWFANAYLGGKRLGAGCGGYQSVATAGPVSAGPAITAFNPPNPSTIPANTTLSYTNLVGYPFNANEYTDPQRARRDTDYITLFSDGWNVLNGIGYWTWTDYINQQDGVWIDTPTRSGLVFFATMSKGVSYYQNSTTHAQLAKHSVFIYNPTDLAAVAQGQKQQWQIQPSFFDIEYPNVTYPLPKWADVPAQRVNGVAYDSTTQLLYVMVRRAELNPAGGQSRVLVYQIGDNIAPPPSAITTAPVVTINANPAILPEPNASNGRQSIDTTWLSWYTKGATSVSINNGIGSVAANDTKMIKLTGSATYTITATNSIGTTTKSVSITLNGTPAPPPPSSSPTPTPTPSPTPPVDRRPLGQLESIDCSFITGWTFDQDTPNVAINTEIYRDGAKGSGGILIASGLTNVLRSTINSTYGITGNHGFNYATPASLKDGNTHSIYAYGINTNSSQPNTLLLGSPVNLYCATSTPTPTPTTSPTITPTPPVSGGKQVLTQNDFTYIGAIKLPDSTTLYKGLTHRYVNGQFRLLFGSNNTWELTIPAPNMNAPYPNATIIKNWGDVSRGTSKVDSGKVFPPNGIFWDQIGSRLYWTFEDDYNASRPDDPSVGYSTLDDVTGTVTPAGIWRFTGRGAKATNGCLVSVPALFASTYTGGKRLAIGCGGNKSVVTVGPAHIGPALTAFNPPNLSSNPSGSSLAYTKLVGYPFNGTKYTAPFRAQRKDLNYLGVTNDYTVWNPQNGIGYWTVMDGLQNLNPAVWIDLPTKEGVIFFPYMSNGRQLYDCSAPRAEFGSHTWFVYDPDHMGEVALGQKQEWEINATNEWAVQYPGITYPINRNVNPTTGSAFNPIGCGQDGFGRVWGATYDDSTRRLYVAIDRDGWPKGGTIYVYQVGGGGTIPTPSPTPTPLPSPTPTPTPSANNITLNSAIKHQTISGGWESTTFVNNSLPYSSSFLTSWPNYQNQLLDLAVNDIGINRLRLEIKSGTENTVDYWTQQNNGQISSTEYRCYRYSTVNDNSDPNVINPAGFKWAELDWKIDNVVNPMRQKIQARGEKLFVNLNYVAFTSQITGTGCPAGLDYNHDDSPSEYAEFMLAVFQHLQSKYGFVPDTIEVILEPDNTTFWRGPEIGNAIVATANKLAANGFQPKFVAPAVTNMGNGPGYFDGIASVAGALSNLKEISYHRYGGVSPSTLASIVSRATTNNVETSMLEWWSAGNTYQILHEDLKDGRNSAWEWGALAGLGATDMYQVNASNPSSPVLTLSAATKFVRQYFKHIRLGAQRIEATSNNSSFDPLAFVNTNGKNVVVVKAASGGAFTVNNLPAGTYGIFYTTGTQYDINLPDQTISAGQSLTTSIPVTGVITIYAKTVGGSTPTPSPTPTPTCTITSSNWQQTQLTVGNTATMTVTVNNPTVCNGQNIQVYIYEEDPLNPDDLLIGPITQSTNQLTFTHQFTSQDYINGGNESGNESVYFTAQIQGQTTFSRSTQINFYNTPTPSPTPTPSTSPSPTPSITITPTFTPTPTATLTITPSPTQTVTTSPSPTASYSPGPASQGVFSNFTFQMIPKILSGLACYFVRFGMIAVVIAILGSGIAFLLSRGNPVGLANAKKFLIYAIVGGLVIYGVYTIILSVSLLVTGSTNLPWVPLTCP